MLKNLIRGHGTILSFYDKFKLFLKWIEGENSFLKKHNIIPEQACGGSGKIRVVELFRLATAQPKL